MTSLTIHEAAQTTGWSARMLRYVEQLGLVTAPRSTAGYRLYGPAQLQRLRTLHELLEQHQVSLAEIGFARRLRQEPALTGDLQAWFDSEPAVPPGTDPQHELPDADWLAFEQSKHQQLLTSRTETR